jgi:3-isopropylmalate/(R)-2-methylmalate dehydratase small subunit
MESSRIAAVRGRAVPVRGSDIDTDRIIPARYLRTVTFADLGAHAFEDDRAGGGHPFDDPRHRGATVLVSNANFGCGSSREHAPQALMRWGIRAFVAESFAEIFFGNCLANGLPCVVASPADVARLQAAVEAAPDLEVSIDLSAMVLAFSDQRLEVSMPAGPRAALLDGGWDSLGQLLEAGPLVEAAAARLPYVRHFVEA